MIGDCSGGGGGGGGGGGCGLEKPERRPSNILEILRSLGSVAGSSRLIVEDAEEVEKPPLRTPIWADFMKSVLTAFYGQNLHT
jgi:hypothetical protein